MDLSYALTWLIGTSAVFGMARSIRGLRVGQRGWLWIHAAILALIGVGVLLDWNSIGYLALALWGLFVSLPEAASRRVRAALLAYDADRAAFWSRLAAVTHPFDGLPEQARLARSHRCFERGDVEGAKGLLYPLLSNATWAEIAKVELLRFDERWLSIVAHARKQPLGTRDLRLAPLYLRALGEVGDLDGMWTMYGQIPSPLAQEPTLRLLMASYSGMTELVELLLNGPLADMPTSYAEQMRATAEFTRGDRETAERRLSALIHDGSSNVVLAKRRLLRPLAKARLDDSSPANARAIVEFERAIRTSGEALPHQAPPRRAWATVTLTTAMVLVYLLAMPGGTTDPENLVRLGALVVPSELTGDGTAWRILAAGFLHLGVAHLVMNCLGLWVLGSQIERLWNGFVMLGLFLVSSIGSFAFAATFVEASAADPRIFLGASSGVLGLVGAFGSYLAVGYMHLRHRSLGQRFLLVVAVVAAQLVFDWFTPVVSSMLHLTGLAIGAITALPHAFASWRRHHATLRLSHVASED